MTLRHLYIFIAVYQEMSITKAAERLHLAQPRVSQAVKELEEEYGVRLFERLNRKLFVTEKGERLYDYAVHLLELSQEMEEDLLSSGNGGRIRLGSSITAGAFLVPERAARFQEHYPECRLEVSVQNSGKVIRQVLKNELDLGVIEDRAEEEMLVKIPFREDRLYFLCGASHPLAEKEPGITGRNLQFSPVSPGKRKRKPGDHRELSEKLPAVLSAPVGECEQ